MTLISSRVWHEEAAIAEARQRDIFDIALGRIVRAVVAMKGAAIQADPFIGERDPPARVLTPRIIRAHLEANVVDAERAGLRPEDVAELRRIVEEEFLWGTRGHVGMRLGEINERLRR